VCRTWPDTTIIPWPFQHKRRKKKALKSKQKTTPQSAEGTMGSSLEEKTRNLRRKPNLRVKCQSTVGSNLSLFLKMFFEKGRGICFGWDFQVLDPAPYVWKLGWIL
jgi:hypothetical protein